MSRSMPGDPARACRWSYATGAFVKSLRRAGFLRAGFVLDQLEKNLVSADHAKLASGTLLYGLQPDLEIAHLGIERLVTHRELMIYFALGADLALDFPHAQPPALAQPEGVLGKQYQPCQGKGDEP